MPSTDLGAMVVVVQIREDMWGKLMAHEGVRRATSVLMIFNIFQDDQEIR